MRLPNGFGNVSRLPGNRRRPYRARLTAGWRIDETGKKHQEYKTIGYFETKEEGIIALSNYRQNPYDLRRDRITFREVYERFSSEHFPKISEGNIRATRRLSAPARSCTIFRSAIYAESICSASLTSAARTTRPCAS